MKCTDKRRVEGMGVYDCLDQRAILCTVRMETKWSSETHGMVETKSVRCELVRGSRWRYVQLV